MTAESRMICDLKYAWHRSADANRGALRHFSKRSPAFFDVSKRGRAAASALALGNSAFAAPRTRARVHSSLQRVREDPPQ